MSIENAYSELFGLALIALAILVILGFIRSMKGPRIADRIVAVNMIGTITITMIAILAALIGEEYLVDICLIYAMVSFLAVVVLTKVYMGAHEEHKKSKKKEQQKDGMD
ncbi:MAG: monovalent cation/H+ antiporter complex subunit F [Clostridia bacterium]